jgi:TfoX/Sxy family transcriptional regulator of competence genes
MPFNPEAAARIWKLLKRRKHFVEKSMFGGKGYLYQGNLCVAVWQDDLIARVGVNAYQSLKQLKANVKDMDLTGKPMKGWLMIAPAGYATDEDLKFWIETALEFVKTLPAK